MTPGLDDGPGEQPSDERCDCGRDWPWHWYVPPKYPHRARWCAPKVSPCAVCALPDTHTREQELRSVVLGAGVPEALCVYGLDALVEQRPGEEADAFRQRVETQSMADARQKLGVRVGHRQAFRDLRAWLTNASKKPRPWLILHGPPGTGKTTMMAALIRGLVDVAADRWEDRDGRRVLVRQPRPPVSFYRMDDLLDRERIKMRGLDESPVKDVARAPGALFLDELGLAPKPSEMEVRFVERVIGYRADHRMLTIVATNRDLAELAGLDGIYGRRVADRLRAATAVALTGDSWR